MGLGAGVVHRLLLSLEGLRSRLRAIRTGIMLIIKHQEGSELADDFRWKQEAPVARPVRGTSSGASGWGSRVGQVDRPSPPRFIGDSEAMRALRTLAAGVARRDATVLLLGETGSGKEVLARYIHESSPRQGKPFIPVDCSLLNESLIESHLFGHVRGSFTGAVRDSLGFVRAADGGTLFLDEIGELPLPLQAKLLRVIQERSVTPVGATEPVSVDIRIVAATHRNLEAMVEAGQFRQDLFFRLYVVALHVPPLRHRIDDIVPLARHFLKLRASLFNEPVKSIGPAAAALLRRHDWPGNVRELANVVEHALAVCDGPSVEPEHLPRKIHQAPSSAQAPPPVSDLNLLDMEHRLINEALRRTRQNKSAAARLLGIPVKRLRRKLESLTSTCS